jgi:ATP-dependent Lon protease
MSQRIPLIFFSGVPMPGQVFEISIDTPELRHQIEKARDSRKKVMLVAKSEMVKTAPQKNPGLALGGVARILEFEIKHEFGRLKLYVEERARIEKADWDNNWAEIDVVPTKLLTGDEVRRQFDELGRAIFILTKFYRKVYGTDPFSRIPRSKSVKYLYALIPELGWDWTQRQEAIEVDDAQALLGAVHRSIKAKCAEMKMFAEMPTIKRQFLHLLNDGEFQFLGERT